MAIPIDSKKKLSDYLKQYKLGDLTDVVFGQLGNKGTGSIPIDELQVLIKETDVYKKRFAGNVALEAANKPTYSISRYLELEDGYKNAMQGSGLPKTFYDSDDDYAGFISGDISVAEVQRRVNQGFRAVSEANPETIAEMKRLYSVTDGDLAAYFLDPKKGTDILTKQAKAASIAGEAKRQASINLTAEQAEALGTEALEPQTIQKGFADIGKSQGLYSGLIGEDDSISTEEQIGATFGTNQAAAQRVAQRKRKRQAEFDAGGSYAVDRSGVVGLKAT